VECKVYHNVLLNTKSQIDFNCLLQLHMYYNNEEENDMSWECHRVDDYCKEKRHDNIINHKKVFVGIG
jgi:hypothetical protein